MKQYFPNKWPEPKFKASQLSSSLIEDIKVENIAFHFGVFKEAYEKPLIASFEKTYLSILEKKKAIKNKRNQIMRIMSVGKRAAFKYANAQSKAQLFGNTDIEEDMYLKDVEEEEVTAEQVEEVTREENPHNPRFYPDENFHTESLMNKRELYELIFKVWEKW